MSWIALPRIVFVAFGRAVIAVVDYGMGNLRSVARALEVAAGAEVRITEHPQEVLAAERVVVPGVGGNRP